MTGGNGRTGVINKSTPQSSASDTLFVSGLRTPERVDVGVTADGRGQAAEAGRWVWRTRRPGGVREEQGRYLVFWQLADEGWRIHAEFYVTTACTSGPGCGRAK